MFHKHILLFKKKTDSHKIMFFSGYHCKILECLENCLGHCPFVWLLFCIFKAVCCADHVHCCPSGYTCDTSSGQCSKGNEITNWLQKVPAITSEVSVGKTCPDGQSQCNILETCCELASGQYGCCPRPDVSFMNVRVLWLIHNFPEVFFKRKCNLTLCTTNWKAILFF